MGHPIMRKTVPAFGANLAASYSAFGSGVTLAGATAGLRVNTSGIIESHNGTSYVNSGTWLLSGPSSNYEVRITSVGGTTPSGPAVGTWVNCSTSPEWQVQDGLADFVEVGSTFTLQIGLAGTSTAMDSATVDLTADRA